MAAYVALLVLILYGSAGLAEETPRLPWVYKHIAVTRYLETFGSSAPYSDLYLRWPGFFAWTAQLSMMMGLPDPVAWAGLAEPFFALVDALLVLAIARRLRSDGRFAWTSTVLFCVTNWINQNYFAPQGLSYTLYLFIALLLLSTAVSPPRHLGQKLEQLAAGNFTQFPNLSSGPGAIEPPWAVASIVAAYGVICASHQLTPYLTLIVLVPLFALGYFRPGVLALAMIGLALAYLAPNFGFIQSHYGVISGFDPVANALYSPIDPFSITPSQVWSARGSYLISGVIGLTAVAGAVRSARTGAARMTLMLSVMAIAPPFVLLVQAYGGEGRLRVYLFSLPWLTLCAASFFVPIDRVPKTVDRVGRVALGVTVFLLAVLFVPSYFALEGEAQVPRSDVDASEWLDSTVVRGDVVFATSPTFPLPVGPSYLQIPLEAELTRYAQYDDRDLTLADLPGLAYDVAGDRPVTRILVIFSEAQSAYAARHGLYAPGELAKLESEVRVAQGVSIAYQREDVRVYQLP